MSRRRLRPADAALLDQDHVALLKGRRPANQIAPVRQPLVGEPDRRAWSAADDHDRVGVSHPERAPEYRDRNADCPAVGLAPICRDHKIAAVYGAGRFGKPALHRLKARDNCIGHCRRRNQPAGDCSEEPFGLAPLHDDAVSPLLATGCGERVTREIEPYRSGTCSDFGSVRSRTRSLPLSRMFVQQRQSCHAACRLESSRLAGALLGCTTFRGEFAPIGPKAAKSAGREQRQ